MLTLKKKNRIPHKLPHLLQMNKVSLWNEMLKVTYLASALSLSLFFFFSPLGDSWNSIGAHEWNLLVYDSPNVVTNICF